MRAQRQYPPAPPEFADEFIKGGWRRVERLYNARTDMIWKWIEDCGGDELKARRRNRNKGSD